MLNTKSSSSRKSKLSIISDESPEVLGRPAVNTLFCYHNEEKNTKEVVLVDTSILRAVNSTSLSVLLSKVLGEYGKHFRDVMAVIMLNIYPSWLGT